MRFSVRIALALVVLLTASTVAFGQGLNWDGQTGALVTPFAYTAKSPTKSIGMPVVGFHYLNVGDVIGSYSTVSGTVGMFNRAEFGYSRTIVSDSKSPLGKLFDGGYNTFHGKLNVIRENTAKKNFIPAISVGFAARTNVRHVGGVLSGKDTNNGDVYVVATKTITQVPHLPIVLSGGVKGTNSSVFGIAGNAPDWTARGFGTAAIVLPKTPRSTWIVGAEVLQQPKHIAGLPGAVLPTTLAYFVRAIPKAEKGMAFDLGVAQVAGKIMPGVDLNARAQVGMGISYHF